LIEVAHAVDVKFSSKDAFAIAAVLWLKSEVSIMPKLIA